MPLAIKARPSFPRRFDADTRNKHTHDRCNADATRSDKQLEASNDWSYHRRRAFQRVVSVHRGVTEKDSACPENSPKRLRASRKMNYSGIVSGMLVAAIVATAAAAAAAASKNDDDRSRSEFGALTSAPTVSYIECLRDTSRRSAPRYPTVSPVE